MLRELSIKFLKPKSNLYLENKCVNVFFSFDFDLYPSTILMSVMKKNFYSVVYIHFETLKYPYQIELV